VALRKRGSRSGLEPLLFILTAKLPDKHPAFISFQSCVLPVFVGLNTARIGEAHPHIWTNSPGQDTAGETRWVIVAMSVPIAENKVPSPNLQQTRLSRHADVAERDSFNDDERDIVSNGNAGRAFVYPQQGTTDVFIAHSSTKGEVTTMRRTRATLPSQNNDAWASREDGIGKVDAEPDRIRPQVRAVRARIASITPNSREASNQATAYTFPESTIAKDPIPDEDFPA
jgi:hypothetical protein